VLTKRVVAVELTVTDGSTVGVPLWRVTWIESKPTGKTNTLTHAHHTERAARRHVEGLLGQADPALENVYTERI
jgi:hypothetical protein